MSINIISVLKKNAALIKKERQWERRKCRENTLIARPSSVPTLPGLPPCGILNGIG